MKVVVDWLNGRVPGYTSSTATTPVIADWHNGKAAMIGKSYDGTLANGVAATGVDGLTTIVPISAISDWYDYSRMGGIRVNTNYPRSLDNSITATSRQPRRAAARSARPVRARVHDLNTVDGDAHRRHQRLLGRARLQPGRRQGQGLGLRVARPPGRQRPPGPDEQVVGRPRRRNNVPRKLWLSREGHVDPFEYRRAEWVDTLHRWFDHWLLA